MTSPAFPQPLPSGAYFEAYPLETEEDWSTIVDSFDSGARATRARWYYPRRGWRLIGQSLPENDIQEVMGFLRDRKGGSDYFYLNNYANYLWRPYDAPTSSTTVSGALAQRTYYTQFTWYNGTYETTPSEEDSQLVAANSVLTITVPPFPRSVTIARLYISTSTTTEKLVSKLATDGGTWTEPTTTVNVDSASGQPILNVAASTYVQAGDYLIINSGGGREEKKVVSTTGAGTITFTQNLTYTHTAGQADVVQIDCTSGATVPTSNNYREEVRVKLLNNPQPIRVAAQVWDLAIDVIEDF